MFAFRVIRLPMDPRPGLFGFSVDESIFQSLKICSLSFDSIDPMCGFPPKADHINTLITQNRIMQNDITHTKSRKVHSNQEQCDPSEESVFFEAIYVLKYEI